MIDPDRLTDEARVDLAERLERAEQFAGKSWAKHDVRLLRGAARDLRSTPEAGEGRQVSAEDLARLRRLLNHWDERTPKRTLHGESLARILDALEPAPPEGSNAGTARAEEAGKRVVDEYPETLRRLGENQVTSSGPLPASPLLALAEELEARADEQSGDYQVPIGDWSVRRWSQLRAWKGATLAYRKAAALARDYASREEGDDD